MYEDYFGFRQLPFSLSPDPQFLYFSAQHREALARLLYGLKDEGGFIVLSGEVGTGKTTLLQEFKQRAPQHVKIAEISNPMLTPKQILQACCEQFGIEELEGKDQRQLFEALQRQLIKEHHSGHNCLILIDEAQDMPLNTLEQLRLLTNVQNYGRHILQVLLCGQSELVEILALREMRQVQQRVVSSFHLEPLPESAIEPYIRHRLAVVGGSDDLFNKKCYQLIASYSRGIPRLINKICHQALVHGFSGSQTQVQVGQIKAAAKEIEGLGPLQRQPISVGRAFSMIGFAVGVAGLIALALVLWQRYGDELTAARSEAVAEPVEISASTFDFTPAADPYDFAAQALFDRWGIPVYQPNNGKMLCGQAAEQGLSCLRDEVDAAQLARLNRPAMLTHETSGWQTLIEFQDGEALFAQTGELITDSDFAQEFSGEVLLLLRLPPGWQGSVGLGSSGFEVFWLIQQLSKVMDVNITLNQQLEYDQQVQQLVQDFQEQQGLPVTGTFDLWTLLSLNKLLFPSTPLLAERNASQ